MTTSRITKFVKQLQKKYPIAPEVIMTVNLCSGPIKASNGILRGTVVFKEGTADIYVDSSQEDILTLKTIGHEYRHILQRINMNWNTNNDLDREADANLFGGMVAREFYYGTC